MFKKYSCNLNINIFAYICTMNLHFEKYKGIHPGKIIDRELKKRSVKQRPFAISLNEHPQTFNAITKGKRGISTSLALKIERALNLKEGTIVILQAFYDIQKIKEKENQLTPDLSIINKSLFWDTDIAKINWNLQYRAVIEKVFERGDENEKKEISRFYGEKKIKKALEESKNRKPYRVNKI